MKMRKTILFLSIILALILVVCACGGSQDTNGNTNTETNTETSTETETNTETNTNTAVECEHEWETIKGTSPTCTEPGTYDGMECKKCDLAVVPDGIIPPTGHTRETIPAVMPTCTEDGFTAGAKCSTCGEILLEPQIIASRGHTETILPAVEPTCTKDGKTEGKYCSACQTFTKKQEVIKSKGHNEVDGTCTVCNLYLWEPAPTDQELNIITADSSDFIIVYEAYSDELKEIAEALANHIWKTYTVNIPVYDYFDKPSGVEHEIVIGSANPNSKYVRVKAEKSNDFIFDICGDDLFLYAPNKYLYDYMLEIVKVEIFDGEGDSLTLESDFCFTYQESDYKNLNYAQYLKQKNGNYNYNSLLNIFDAQVFESSDGTVIPYRIYVPSSYDPSKEYPLLTILHGAGERGNDNKSQLINMVSDLFNQANSPYMEAIIVCPQCPSGQQWVDTPWANGNYSTASVPVSNELDAVLGIMTNTIADLSVDTDRLYLMGLSMGGFGVWDLLMRNPTVFAGAVALCGGADPSQASSLTTVPIWAVHGTNDNVVPYAGTQAMCQAIKDAGGELCVFDSKQGYSHNVWGYVGGSTEIAAWLFSQSKQSLFDG